MSSSTANLWIAAAVIAALPSLDTYRDGVAAARDAYLQELDDARAAALEQGDLEGATALLKTRALVATHTADDLFDPFLVARRDVAESSWTQSDGARTKFPSEKTGGWAIVDEHVVAQYAEKSGNVYIWTMNADHTEAVIRRWVPDHKFPGKTAKRAH